MFKSRNKSNNDWVNFIFLIQIWLFAFFSVVINARIFIILLVVLHLYHHSLNDVITVGHAIDVMKIVNMKHPMEISQQRLKILEFYIELISLFRILGENEKVPIDGVNRKFPLKINCRYLVINIVMCCVGFFCVK
jgi:hypothetical protein